MLARTLHRRSPSLHATRDNNPGVSVAPPRPASAAVGPTLRPAGPATSRGGPRRLFPPNAATVRQHGMTAGFLHTVASPTYVSAASSVTRGPAPVASSSPLSSSPSPSSISASTSPSPALAPAASLPSPAGAGEEGSVWQPLNGRTAVVVGAGPAGSTLALHLARAGWLVQVFEKRPEPSANSASRQRSWPVALYPRGIRPITAVAEVPLAEERNYKGILVIPERPQSAPPITYERAGVLMDRTLLATSLLGAARSRYASRVTVTFEATLERLDLTRRTALFATVATATATATAAISTSDVSSHSSSSSGGSSSSSSSGRNGDGNGGGGGDGAAGRLLEVPYDMLVGADGTNSTVQAQLVKAYPGEYDHEVLSPTQNCYKAWYGMPPLPQTDAWEPDRHVSPEARVKGLFFYILSPKDGDFKTGWISLCRDVEGDCFAGYLAGPETLFAQLQTKEDYMSVLSVAAPQLPDAWRPLIADQLAAGSLSKFSQVRYVPRFWAPGGVVLVGDAAHTVSPALGQGLNSALQDCEELTAALEGTTQSPERLDAALARFSSSRVPEIEALLQLEMMMTAYTDNRVLRPTSDPVTALTDLLTLRAHKVTMGIYTELSKRWSGAAAAAAAAARRAAAQGQAGEQMVQGQDGQGKGQVARTADILEEQLGSAFLRSPPLFEIQGGFTGYRSMLARVYGVAVIATACTAAALYGITMALYGLVGPVLFAGAA